MHIEELRDFCLGLPLVEEKFPFDEVTLAFYIGGKIFCLAKITEFKMLNVKCNPDKALELRANYHAVIPGYHMNKKHWNTILVNEDAHDDLIKEWIRDSYYLVLQSIPKSRRPIINE